MAYSSECTETFQQAHVSAFEFFGGVPTKIAYDNATIAVNKVMLGPNRELTNAFLSLQSHYLFTHRFCRVASGHEKGHVENHVGYHQRNFLIPVPSFASFAAFNDYADERCMQELTRITCGADDTNAERLEVDRAAVRAFPKTIFEARRVVHAQSNSFSLVRFDRNDYSVPPSRPGGSAAPSGPPRRFALQRDNSATRRVRRRAARVLERRARGALRCDARDRRLPGLRARRPEVPRGHRRDGPVPRGSPAGRGLRLLAPPWLGQYRRRTQRRRFHHARTGRSRRPTLGASRTLSQRPWSSFQSSACS
jgi:hypothetical protein